MPLQQKRPALSLSLEHSMEIPFGKKWVVPVANLTTLIVFIGLMSSDFFQHNIRLALGFLFGSLFTLPYVFRFIICHDWIPIEAKILHVQDQTRSYYHWRGVGISSRYDHHIEYYISGNQYKAVLSSSKPILEPVKTIYCSPKHHDFFTQKQGLGVSGWLFFVLIALILVVIICKTTL